MPCTKSNELRFRSRMNRRSSIPTPSSGRGSRTIAQKYKSMDLLGGDTKERKIYDALKDEILLEFNEAPLSEVVDYLKTARQHSHRHRQAGPR